MILSIYAGRVFDLMVIKGADLAAKGENQRTATIPLPADRGPIYDSTGAVLALTVESRNVTADQNLIKDPADAAASSGRPARDGPGGAAAPADGHRQVRVRGQGRHPGEVATGQGS